MAKSRKTSRPAGARKTTRRRSKRAARAPKKVELRPVRRQLEAHRKALGRVEQTQQVKRALKRIQRCLAEIEGICGADMSIPLP